METAARPFQSLISFVRFIANETGYRPRLAGARLLAGECRRVAIVTMHLGIDDDRLAERAGLVVGFRRATEVNGRLWRL
jgi:hypothetical protein